MKTTTPKTNKFASFSTEELIEEIPRRHNEGDSDIVSVCIWTANEIGDEGENTLELPDGNADKIADYIRKHPKTRKELEEALCPNLSDDLEEMYPFICDIAKKACPDYEGSDEDEEW